MKTVTVLFVIFLLMTTPITAEKTSPGILPNSPLHSLDKAVDNAKLAIKSGEDKAILAMQIKQERLAEVQFLLQQGIRVDAEDVESAVLDAQEKAKIVQEEVTPEIKEEVDEDAEESVQTLASIKEELPASGIEGFEDIETLLNQQMTEEEKTKLAGELAEKIGSLCEGLAKQDYDLMLEEPKCDPDNAPDWLKDKLEGELKEGQDDAIKEAIDQITTCFEDPRTCDCSNIPVQKAQQNCEKGKALAIRCEFKQERDACEQLDEMDKEMLADAPAFMRPFISDTIEKLKSKKEKEMFAKFAPPECVETGVSTREECEKIMIEKYMPQECKERGAFTREECEKVMTEIHGPPPEECMQDGRFIGEEECKKIMEAKGPREGPEGMGMPQPCIEANALTPEECEKVMKEFGEKACKGLSQEECMKKMSEIMGGPEMPPTGELLPEECVGLTEEECEALIGKVPGEEEAEADICKGLTPEECEKLYKDLYEEEKICMIDEDCEEGEKCVEGLCKKEEVPVCPEIMFPPACAENEKLETIYDNQGCVIDYACIIEVTCKTDEECKEGKCIGGVCKKEEVPVCPEIMFPPACAENEKLETIYDNQGCVIDYACIIEVTCKTDEECKEGKCIEGVCKKEEAIEKEEEEIIVPPEKEISECVGLSPAECESKMKEKFGVEKEKEEGYRIPEEMISGDKKVLITPEGTVQIDKEVLDRIIEKSERMASKEIKPSEDVIELNKKIDEIEEKRRELDFVSEEKLPEVARQIEERVREEVREEPREEIGAHREGGEREERGEERREAREEQREEMKEPEQVVEAPPETTPPPEG